MNRFDVRHILDIYKTRLKMQEEGITNPAQVYKDITLTIVEKLSKLPLDEEMVQDGHLLKDTRGNIIVEFPSHEYRDEGTYEAH